MSMVWIRQRLVGTMGFTPPMPRFVVSISRLVMTVFSWHVLKVIGASYFSSATIVVPLLGYLIFFGSYTDGVYTFDFGKFSMGVSLASESGGLIRLKLTYAGLALFGFTTIVYRLFCPQEISAHRDQQTFVESSIAASYGALVKRSIDDLRNGVWYKFAIRDYDEVNELEIRETPTNAVALRHHDRPPPLDRADWLEKNLDALNVVFSLTYEVRDYSAFFIRAVIIIGYISGFVLVMVPSLEVFSFVWTDVRAYLGTVLGWP